MIQVPHLKNISISEILKGDKSSYKAIPQVISADEFIDPKYRQEIVEIEEEVGTKIERKAYIINCAVKNYGLDKKRVKIIEQRYSQGPSWCFGFLDYYPRSIIPFFTRFHILSQEYLHTCQVTKTLINNHLQCGNIKVNLFGQGIIVDENIIDLKQLLVFEIAHPLKKNDSSIVCVNLIPQDFTPSKIPFRN